MTDTQTVEIPVTAQDKTGVHISRARKGDLIVTKHSGDVYRVDAVARVNIQCTDMDGKHWNVRMFRRDGITPNVEFAPAGTVFFEQRAANAADAKDLVLGTVVKYARGHRANGDKFVVIGGFGPFKIARLGGDGNRYVRGVLAEDLEVVPQP